MLAIVNDAAINMGWASICFVSWDGSEQTDSTLLWPLI